MPSKPKTGRHRATVRGAILAQELGVVRTTVLAHMHRLGIEPHYAFGRQVMFTPHQAKQITDSINQIKTSLPTPPGTFVGGGSALTPERTSVLVDALSKGATSVDLVRDHKITLKECDTIMAWWRREQGEVVLSREIMTRLEKRVGRFATPADLVTVLEDAILAASTCYSCGTTVPRVLCSTCIIPAHRNGRSAPKAREETEIDLSDEKLDEYARKLIGDPDTEPASQPEPPGDPAPQGPTA